LLLSVDDLHVQYGEAPALRGLHLSLHHGETLALVGRSGSGKSTLARAVLRLLPPHATVRGGIRYAGRDLLPLPERQMVGLRGRHIALMLQDPSAALHPFTRIGAQLAEALYVNRGVPLAEGRAQAAGWLARMGLPPRVTRSYPHELSGGMKQRAALAIALAPQPDLLLADEPTSALDVTTQAQILGLLRRVQQAEGLGMLFITHDMGIVAALADRVAVIEGGRIVEHGPTAQVLGAAQHTATRALLAAARPLEPPPPEPPAPALLQLEGVHVAYKRVQAVRGADLRVAPGQTLALIGESGSGKTSLVRAVLGAAPVTAGAIRFMGADITGMPQRRATMRHIGFVGQQPAASLDPRMPVWRIITQNARIHRVGARTDRRRTAEELIKAVGLPPDAATRRAGEFSGGQVQRIALARALCTRPRLLLLDEPTSALDSVTRARIMALLADLRTRYGVAMLFVAHDLLTVRGFAHRAAVMAAGRIVEAGPTAQVFTAPQHPATQALMASLTHTDR
jgi:peptide/nickel transport system ATP-binding protein